MLVRSTVQEDRWRTFFKVRSFHLSIALYFRIARAIVCAVTARQLNQIGGIIRLSLESLMSTILWPLLERLLGYVFLLQGTQNNGATLCYSLSSLDNIVKKVCDL